MVGFIFVCTVIATLWGYYCKDKRLKSSRDLFKIDALELFVVEVKSKKLRKL